MKKEIETLFATHKPNLYARFQDVAAQRQAAMQLIMERVHNPSNLGAIARSCDGFGVQQMSFQSVGEHAKIDRLMRKSSVAASQWLDYTSFEDTSTYFTQLQREGWYIMATSSEVPGDPLYDIDFTRYPKLAIAVGNEAQGLSTTALEQANQVLYIPMCGVGRSLNVAVATAILLATATHQRQAKAFLLTSEEQQALVTRLVARYLAAHPMLVKTLAARCTAS